MPRVAATIDAFLKAGTASEGALAAMEDFDATQEAAARAAMGAPRIFSVRDYGAVADGATDDTAAINLAIAAAWNAGGGTVYFPAGHYRCAGAMNATTNSVLTCPQDEDYQLTRRTISLIGEGTGWMTAGYEDIGTGGVALDFRDVTASGTKPSAIAFAPYVENPQFENILTEWNNVNVVIDNLMVVVAGNSISGINANNALCLKIGDGVAVHAAAQGPPDSLLEPDLVNPTSSGSEGIIFPAVLNNIRNDCGSCDVSGFWKGITAGEHCFFKRPSIIFCGYGLYVPKSAHLISGSLSIENCISAVVTTGTLGSVLNLELQVEMSDLSVWWEGVYGFQGGGSDIGQIVHSSYNKATDVYPNNFPISGGTNLVFRDLRKEGTEAGASGIVLYRGTSVGFNTVSPLAVSGGSVGGVAATVYNGAGGASLRARGSSNAAIYLEHTGAGSNLKLYEIQNFGGNLTFSAVADNLLSATVRLSLPTTGGLRAVQRTPSSATDTGTAGTICADANYIYHCYADNQWKRVAISTW